MYIYNIYITDAQICPMVNFQMTQSKLQKKNRKCVPLWRTCAWLMNKDKLITEFESNMNCPLLLYDFLHLKFLNTKNILPGIHKHLKSYKVYQLLQFALAIILKV